MIKNKEKIRIGVLVSGGGSNLQAIMDACNEERIYGHIVCVGSDSHDAYGLKRAEKQGIKTFVVDYTHIIKSGDTRSPLPDDFDLDEIVEKQHLFSKGGDQATLAQFFSTRAIAESELLEELMPFKLDLLVLAGFMRVLTPYFIDRFTDQMKNQMIMNIHPALLPSFPGVDGYGDAYRFGCKVSGCTVHFVDYGADTGPIIGQKAFAIFPNDTLETIKERGLALEWALYSECIDLFAKGLLETVHMTYERKKTIYQRTVVKIASPV